MISGGFPTFSQHSSIFSPLCRWQIRFRVSLSFGPQEIVAEVNTFGSEFSFEDLVLRHLHLTVPLIVLTLKVT